MAALHRGGSGGGIVVAPRGRGLGGGEVRAEHCERRRRRALPVLSIGTALGELAAHGLDLGADVAVGGAEAGAFGGQLLCSELRGQEVPRHAAGLALPVAEVRQGHGQARLLRGQLRDELRLPLLEPRARLRVGAEGRERRQSLTPVDDGGRWRRQHHPLLLLLCRQQLRKR